MPEDDTELESFTVISIDSLIVYLENTKSGWNSIPTILCIPNIAHEPPLSPRHSSEKFNNEFMGNRYDGKQVIQLVI